jgi:hypothetical protein
VTRKTHFAQSASPLKRFRRTRCRILPQLSFVWHRTRGASLRTHGEEEHSAVLGVSMCRLKTAVGPPTRAQGADRAEEDGHDMDSSRMPGAEGGTTNLSRRILR